MSRKVIFPFQKISLKNLPKEKWRGIPDFEGYYEISNYGRVKALSRERVLYNGGVYTSKEKIRKSALDVKMNVTVNKPLYSLHIALIKEGRVYNLMIARLVYKMFVKDFNLEDQHIRISYKDHDGRNVHASNLLKSDIGTIRKDSYERGRIINPRRKPITQFDVNGVPLRIYPSAFAAVKENNFSSANISVAANRTNKLHKGYFWRYGEHYQKLDLTKIGKKTKQKIINKNLIKHLRIREIKGNIPPLVDLSVESLRGERWIDIHGYKGLYKISNLGRIKVSSKMIPGMHPKWMSERIQRLQIDWSDKEKRIPKAVVVNLVKNKKFKKFSVASLVYTSFTRKIHITKREVQLDFKDGNPLNICYKNLVKKIVRS